MSDAWYEGVPESKLTSEADRAYAQALAVVREGLAQGKGFDDACSRIDTQSESLKAVIIDDLLKVIIAEEHFNKGISLENLSSAISVSLDRLESAKKSMFEDVEKDSVREFHKSLDQGAE